MPDSDFKKTIKTNKGDIQNVLHALCYFDLFNYPLTAEEVFERSVSESLELVELILTKLVRQKQIFLLKDKFYSISEDLSLVKRRLDGNELSTVFMHKALRISSFISQFPYVRSVMISGSLSKNYMDENSDIDYFIITAPNRLWIARLCFFLTQKLIFFNKTKFLCFNYMIDTEALELSDRSIFTATEVATVIPTYGGGCYQRFLSKNEWIRKYYPNYPLYDVKQVKENHNMLKKMVERGLNNDFGNWLDLFLMKTTEKRWRKIHKAKMFGKNGENLFLNRHIAKAHFGGNYEKVLNLFQQKLKSFESITCN